jgi:hypothetical protein
VITVRPRIDRPFLADITAQRLSRTDPERTDAVSDPFLALILHDRGPAPRHLPLSYLEYLRSLPELLLASVPHQISPKMTLRARHRTGELRRVKAERSRHKTVKIHIYPSLRMGNVAVPAALGRAGGGRVCEIGISVTSSVAARSRTW